MKTKFTCYLINAVIKFNIIAVSLLLSVSAHSQVGINTDTPRATLDIVGLPNQPGIVDGIIPPRISGDALRAKDAIYGTNQTGSIIFVTAPVTLASTKTASIIQSGYYYFDGTKWSSFGGNGVSSSTSSQGAVKVNVNQSNFITLTGTQSYGLLMQNQGVTINPIYAAGAYPGGGSGSPTDVITLTPGGDNGALLLEAPSSNKGNFFRMNIQFIMGNNPPAQTRYFNVRVVSKTTGALVYENSVVVPGGLNTGHVVPFQIFFMTIADSSSIGVGYRIYFVADTAASTGLPNNIGIKIIDITRANQG